MEKKINKTTLTELKKKKGLTNWARLAEQEKNYKDAHQTFEKASKPQK